MTEVLCPNCGEPLDDYGPCACGLSGDAPRKAGRPRKKGPSWSMRTMVQKKLARERGEAAAVTRLERPSGAVGIVHGDRPPTQEERAMLEAIVDAAAKKMEDP